MLSHIFYKAAFQQHGKTMQHAMKVKTLSAGHNITAILLSEA